MPKTLLSRMVALLIALAVCILALVFIIQPAGRTPPVQSKMTAAAPTASPSAPATPTAPKQENAALPAPPKEAVAPLAKAAATPSATDNNDGIPSFDIARIEPTGEAVIAGRAAPGATIELLRNGEVHDRIVTDRSGQFAMVPPRLPPGSYELTLRAKQPDGKEITSKQSIAVALEAKQNERPVVALIAPDKPIEVLSQPTAPAAPAAAKAAAAPVTVQAVESQPGGKLHVSGSASPGGSVRFYLNDSFITSATAGADGRFSITINEGVTAGNYRVRLDEVEPNSGAVRTRAEVPFNVPATVVAAAPPPPAAPAPAAAPAVVPTPSTPAAAPPAASVTPPAPVAAPAPVASASPAPTPAPVQPTNKPADATAQQPRVAAAAPAPPAGPSPASVVVPRIETMTVSRGDNLWRISRTTYGAGMRYAVIYRANRDQIRDPDLIYPGQVFVLPAK